MKKLALVAAGSCVLDFWELARVKEWLLPNKDMSQQTAKAGARQPSGKKVKEFSLQEWMARPTAYLITKGRKFTSNFGLPGALFACRH